MTYPIPNYSRIWVRGRFIDLARAAREEVSYGLTGPVQFLPKIPVALNSQLLQIIGMKPFVADPDPDTGYFQIQIPSTNDPQINPVDFSWEVIEPTGRRYLIKVPYDTPTLFDPEDDLNGEQVLELVNVVPDPEDPEGTVQLLVGQPGRSIESVTVDEDGHLVGEYDDGLTFDAGLVPGVQSVNGETADVILSPTDLSVANVFDVTGDEVRAEGYQGAYLYGLTAPSGGTDATNKTYVDDGLDTKVGLTGDETIDGAKTFSDPASFTGGIYSAFVGVDAAPAFDSALANKLYVDTGLAGKAASSHTHAASAITSGNLDAARMPQVSSAVTAATGVSGAVTIDPTVNGNFRDYTATGNITFNDPAAGSNYQIIKVRVLASGGTRTVTIHANTRVSTGLTRGAHSIASGEIWEAVFEYSSLISDWIVTAYTTSAA